jgi:transcriptional regulator with XRE-family HTH domain
MITPVQSKMARVALGWTTSDLAEKAQVSAVTVNRFETMARKPIPATLAAIRRAFEDAGVVFTERGVDDVRPPKRTRK